MFAVDGPARDAGRGDDAVQEAVRLMSRKDSRQKPWKKQEIFRVESEIANKSKVAKLLAIHSLFWTKIFF